jgi:glucosamine-6-phosphate deaminase
MKINIHEDKKNTSKFAAEKAKDILIETIEKKGKAVFVIATGNSQLDFLDYLVNLEDIDWSKTTLYHLDEYVGINEDHRASFRKYIRNNFISKVGEIKKVNLIDGMNNPERECQRLNKIIAEDEIDISFVGIGENGHLAFNEPPADFETEDPFIVVELDEMSRKQQVKEGWFDSIKSVPKKAITMTIKEIMSSEHIICTVPEKRKAEAVKNCLGNEIITPDYPASILKKHKSTYVYLDENSAELLDL